MPPKAKSRTSAKGKAKSVVDSRKETCAAVIAAVFPDFAEDTGFCSELAEKVLHCAASITDPSELQDALEDALAGRDDVMSVLADVHSRLVLSEILSTEAPNATEGEMADSTEGVSAEDKKPKRVVVSVKKMELTFSKELKNRERSAGGHQISPDALACQHSWDNSGAGGMLCQICNFETKDRSYSCSRECDVRLCGKCWWKWKEKL